MGRSLHAPTRSLLGGACARCSSGRTCWPIPASPPRLTGRLNGSDIIAELEKTFGTKPLAHWTDALPRQKGQWDVVSLVSEVEFDPQAVVNGFIQQVSTIRAAGAFPSSPTRFSSTVRPRRCSPPQSSAPIPTRSSLRSAWTPTPSWRPRFRGLSSDQPTGGLPPFGPRMPAMALPNDVQVVSVDDHVIEHRTVWQDRLPAKYKEAGPKNVRDDQGRDVWMFEGRPYFNGGLGAVAGKPREEYGLDPVRYEDMRPGLLRPEGPDRGYGSGRGARPGVLSHLRRLCRQHVLQCHGQGAGHRLRYGVQRLDDRRVVRRDAGPADPVDSRAVLGHRRHGQGSQAGRRKGRQGFHLHRDAPCARAAFVSHPALGSFLRHGGGGRDAAEPPFRLRRGARRSHPTHRSPRPSPCSG